MASASASRNAAVCGTSGTCVTYDALGRAVEKNVSGSYKQILYSPLGKTAIMNGQTLTNAYVPMPGGQSSLYDATGAHYVEHHDWRGSVVLRTSLINRSKDYDRAFAPFGEMYDNFGSSTMLNFTGDTQDLASGLFDTPNRELAPTQGRWISPDPAGRAAVDLTNPQSWNGYAYVLNNPLSYTDPLGLECVWDDGSFDSADDPHTGSIGGCQNAGGTWFDPSTFQAGGGQDWNPNPNQDIASLFGGVGADQWVGNDTGYGITSTPTSQVTVNGTTGQVDYVDWGFANSDIPLSPFAQRYANAISLAVRNFPNPCGLGGAVYLGKGRVGAGVSADTQNGIKFASGFNFFDVKGAKTGYTISGGANGNISYSVPTPLGATVDIGTQNGSLRSIQSVSLSSKSSGWRNYSVYANLSNMGDPNCK